MIKAVAKSLDNPAERAARLKSGPKNQKNHRNKTGHNQSYRQAKVQQFCGRYLHCGSSKHKSNCPKTNLHCNRCNRSGHTGYVCLSNPQPKTVSQHRSHQQSRQPSPTQSQNCTQSLECQHRASVLTVAKNTTSAIETLPELQLSFSQNKNFFHYMVTCITGATISEISLSIIQHYKLQIQDTSELLLMADGNPMAITGRIFLTINSYL